MQVVLLAGGLGTRLSEETAMRPKPMVEIGGRPMLWHLMQLYASYGYREFLVACGYRGETIKDYFHNLSHRTSDYIVDLANGSREILRKSELDWKVGAVDTGMDTQTGGRLRRLRRIIGDTPCMVTYGDGLADIDIAALVAFHKSHGKLATITAVRPPARFGELVLEGQTVRHFAEKPQTSQGWINGGFFVFEPGVFDYLDDGPLERGPLERLAQKGELMAFTHEGFWQPMDTIREKQLLEELWQTKKAPWLRPTRDPGRRVASS